MGTGAKSHFYSGWRFGFFVGNQTGSTIFDQHLQLELVPELPRAGAISNGGCTTTAWCQWQQDSPRDMARPSLAGPRVHPESHSAAGAEGAEGADGQRVFLTTLHEGSWKTQGESLEDFQDGHYALKHETAPKIRTLQGSG